MLTALLLAVLGASPAPLETSTELTPVRVAFLEGDLVTLSRARGLLQERGVDVSVGELGLFDDLSRLVRCLPIGPIPAGEARTFRGARTLARLERIRLERVLRDAELKHSRIAEIVAFPLFQDRGADQSADIVAWPTEEERWRPEMTETLPERRACPSSPGAWKEPLPEVHRARRAIRVGAERSGYAEALSFLDALPRSSASKIAFAYLDHAASVASFQLPPTWFEPIESALHRGEPDLESAGVLLLAGFALGNDDPANAERLYRAVLSSRAPTAEEASRARVRLVILLEPRWEEVLSTIDAANMPRAVDLPALDNARARALYSLGRFDELMSFGRKYVRSQPPKSEHDEQTRDLLLRVALRLEPAAAIAWAEELAEGDVESSRTKLEALASIALGAKDLVLATNIYDRLRIEASTERERRGPNAAAAEARFIAQRALVEVERDDIESFAGLVDDLIALAKKEEARPLARFAPHRELARLNQELVPRLVGEVEAKPERRRYAGVLLEATVALAPGGVRWRPILEQDQDALTKLAGPWATGRTASAKARDPRKKPKHVRQLGQIVIPRLPPALAAPDYPTERPIIRSFLVYPDVDGTLIDGVPWAHRIVTPE